MRACDGKKYAGRILAALLCVLVLTAVPAAALGSEAAMPLPAEERPAAPLRETEILPDPETASPNGTSGNTETAASCTPEEQLALLTELCGRIRTALLAGRSSVTISDLAIPVSAAQVRHIGYYCPYLDGTNISALLYYQSSSYSRIALTNGLGQEQTVAWIDRIDAGLAELAAVADQSLSPEERVLRLHDYMCAHYHYDTALEKYYPAILMTEGLGVCQSYAYLFQYVMVQQGVECYAVESDGMNHAWNMVKLNGHYYHLDVTWDDPVQDNFGLAGHSYFLLTDATVGDENHEHYGWDLTELVCDDASFETAYMTAAGSPVAFLGSDRYYCGVVNGKQGLFCMHADTGSVELAAEIGYWYVFESTSSYYPGRIWAGLYEYRGRLYFNTYREVLVYDPSTGKTEVFCQPDTADGYIYGMLGEGDRLIWSCQQTPSVPYDSKDLRKIELQFLMGDVTCDGAVTLEDVAVLFRHVTGRTHLTAGALAAADMDEDGNVALNDVALLYRRYVQE
ncbi:MAG: hypothetical protein IKH56_06920 [Oscillospiraceae bacterium]|nr:hypothetical protein [Oscillospiraceae bacterium]